jgi:hypothetical protein
VIELAAVFWIFVMLFGIIGLMRGWTKELLVTASIILALFVLEELGNYVFDVMVSSDLAQIAADPEAPLRRLVMLRASVLLIITFFGYQGPTVVHFATRGRVAARPGDSLQEGLLGLMIGGVNGYLVIGALWWYLQVYNYPFTWVIPPGSESLSIHYVRFLPLQWMTQGPLLTVLLVIFFLFVIIAVV